jgi:hypothetical protein
MLDIPSTSELQSDISNAISRPRMNVNVTKVDQ